MSSQQPQLQSNKQWFLLYCKARDERRAQENLANQGIESYFPQIEVEKIRRGKKVRLEEALFPSYLFVLLDTSSSNFNAVRSTRGVVDFVKCGAAYMKVAETLVAELKSGQHHLGVRCQLPDAGTEVEISHGPFKGLTGIFQKSDGLERSMLLIKMLNQENEVSIANRDLAL